jgi:hypothetical protein
MTEKEASRIIKAIRQYSRAYQELDDLQGEDRLIPIGDQKTGCIGEFYAMLYVKATNPKSPVRFTKPSSKGWDIEVELPGSDMQKIQVKTVSAYSKKRMMTPIHEGWDDLYVLHLDRHLEPDGFWIVPKATISAREMPLRGMRCPDPEKGRIGSRSIHFGENLVAELRRGISQSRHGSSLTTETVDEFALAFDLTPIEEVDALAARIEGRKTGWFSCFRLGWFAFNNRIFGVKKHFREAHSWPRPPNGARPLRTADYQVATILFHMDSAMECLVFALNGLGNAVNPSEFLKVADAGNLRRVAVWNVIGNKKRKALTGLFNVSDFGTRG